MPLTHEERMIRAVRFNEERKAGIFAGRIATRDKLILGELSDEEIAQLVSIYPAWEVGVDYKIDDVIAYQGTLFKVIQEHTAQADWTPDVADSLFTSFTPIGTIADWVQPEGGHDAYPLGAKVKHNEQIWVSTVADNVWEPGVHGWEVD